MSDIIIKEKNLPQTIEELDRFITVGQEEVRAHKALLRAIKKTEGESENFLNRLADTQTKAEIMIDAMVAMGEMLGNISKQGDRYSSTGGTIPTLPSGVGKKKSHYAQEIASHKEIVKAVKEIERKAKNVVSWNRVYREIKAREKVDVIIPEIEGMYRIIYADPPWKYGNTMPDKFTEQGGEYPLMSIDQICQIKVKEHIQDNAVLFLWVTWPILKESFKIIKAWGFEYKTGWCWDKVKHVMGHYNSVRSELVLLGIKGSCPLDNRKLFDNVFSIERKKHSAKPEYMREIIDTIYPRGNALELFFRGDKLKLSQRWSVSGNEI